MGAHILNVNNAVVIVAAGRGMRATKDADSNPNSNSPKQYVKIAGKAILQHTVEKFTANKHIKWVQIVIHEDDKELYEAAVANHEKLLPPVMGGNTRQISCAKGLKGLANLNPEKVLIHDAARPFVDETIINDVMNAIKNDICALPAAPIADTLKLAKFEGNAQEQTLEVQETIPREGIYSAQTPQGFMYKDIMSAHDKASSASIDNLTDDAAVAQNAGMKVIIVPSSASNTKITNYADIQNMKKSFKNNSLKHLPDVRNGCGYDIHRLKDGDGVILCGVKIKSDKMLDGHSDADVAMHAITDALLGTIGSGDIGSHFPPSDEQWKGAKSDQFLAHACKLVREEGGMITHIDVSIICEYPKVGPHREAMRENLAKICELDIKRVSVKATTNEEIGAVGRGEGIAALASATAVFANED